MLTGGYAVIEYGGFLLGDNIVDLFEISGQALVEQGNTTVALTRLAVMAGASALTLQQKIDESARSSAFGHQQRLVGSAQAYQDSLQHLSLIR